MNKIEDLATKASQQLTTTQTTQAGQMDSTPEREISTTSFEEMDRKFVNQLFVRLQEIFPKWREIWQSDGEIKAAKRQWTKTLVRHGVSDAQMIQLGLDEARESGWVRPPSAGQFVNWCIEGAKEKAGVPSKENAVSQIMAIARKSDHARKRTRLCPAMYQVSRFIDWYDFRRLNADDSAKAIARAYDQMVDHWRSGRPFAEQPTMIEHGNPSGVTHTRESREAGLERIRKLRESLK